MAPLDPCPLHARLAAAVLAACPPRHPRRFLRPLESPTFVGNASYGAHMDAKKAVLALGSIATHSAREGRPSVAMPGPNSRQDVALTLIEACSHHGKDHALRPVALRTARDGVLLAFDDQSALLGRLVPHGTGTRLVLWPAACALHHRANGKTGEHAWRFEGMAGRSNAVDPRLRVFALTGSDTPSEKQDVGMPHTWAMLPHPKTAVQQGLDALRQAVDAVLDLLPLEAGPFVMADGHARCGAPVPADLAAWVQRPAWVGQPNLWPTWLPHRDVPEEAWAVDGPKVKEALSWIALAMPKAATSLMVMPANRPYVLWSPRQGHTMPYVLLPQMGSAQSLFHGLQHEDRALETVLPLLPPPVQEVVDLLVRHATGLRFAPATPRAALPEPRLLDTSDLPRIRVDRPASAHQGIALVQRYGPAPAHIWA